jgi:hypothetical protein
LLKDLQYFKNARPSDANDKDDILEVDDVENNSDDDAIQDAGESDDSASNNGMLVKHFGE